MILISFGINFKSRRNILRNLSKTNADYFDGKINQAIVFYIRLMNNNNFYTNLDLKIEIKKFNLATLTQTKLHVTSRSVHFHSFSQPDAPNTLFLDPDPLHERLPMV